MSTELSNDAHCEVNQVPDVDTPDLRPEASREVPTYELLGRWIDLVNEHGRDSDEAQAFLVAHEDNAEFARLSAAADQLRELFDRP